MWRAGGEAVPVGTQLSGLPITVAALSTYFYHVGRKLGVLSRTPSVPWSWETASLLPFCGYAPAAPLGVRYQELGLDKMPRPIVLPCWWVHTPWMERRKRGQQEEVGLNWPERMSPEAAPGLREAEVRPQFLPTRICSAPIQCVRSSSELVSP